MERQQDIDMRSIRVGYTGVDIINVEYEVIAERVRSTGRDVIVCLETATDCLGISNGGYLERYQVYSEEYFEMEGIEVIVLKDFYKTKNYISEYGVPCTNVEQTILDMLARVDVVDIQILLESMSNYYYRMGESFEELVEMLGEEHIVAFEDCKQDAIDYYNEG